MASASPPCVGRQLLVLPGLSVSVSGVAMATENPHRSLPQSAADPYFTEPNFIYGFLYALVKPKLVCGFNAIDLLSIFTINLLL